MTVPPPPWFPRAVAELPAHREVVVDGCRIAVLEWGPSSRPAIVLVHGGAAHAWWWGFVAPLLAENHHVLALDLSGHGDSGRRTSYSFPTWAREVAAVVADVEAQQPVVVGHSMGGVVAAVAGPMIPDVGGVVLVDAPLGAPDAEAIGDSEAVFQRVRGHPDRDALVARFRPLPEQPVEHPAMVTWVAERSVQVHTDGYAWKFDPLVFAVPASGRPDDASDELEAAGCPVGAIVGGRSPVVPPPDRDRLRELARQRGGEYVEIADGHHHLMFDQPRRLAAVVALVAGRCVEAGRVP